MADIKNLKVNLEQKILESENVIIVPHSRIDFDAIGSGLGLSMIAKKLRKPAHIVVNDPQYEIDHGVQVLMEEAKRDFSIINKEKYMQIAHPGDLFVLTDVNKSYLVSLNDQLEKERTIIIDHHDEDDKTVEAFEKHIDTGASSASEIIAKLMCLYKMKPSPEVANYLLSGIYLDTNKLRKNVSSETMKTVAKLLDCGASMNYITNLFTEDFASDRHVQELVGKAKFTNISIATVMGDEEERYTCEELAKAADYLLKFNPDAAFAIGNIGDGVISISARSKERVNVGSIMQEMGGGGNQFSAAAKINDSTIEETGKKLMKIIQPPCYIK